MGILATLFALFALAVILVSAVAAGWQVEACSPYVVCYCSEGRWRVCF